MGADTCNVVLTNVPTKKSLHKKWKKIQKLPDDGEWWGMNGYILHESFKTCKPMKQEQWNKIEKEQNNQEDAKWKPGLVGLVWKTKTRNPALKKFIEWLKKLEDNEPPCTSKEEWNEYREWQKKGGRWKPYFFMNDDGKANEIMNNYSKLEVYFANYEKNNKKYQKLLKKMPECPVYTVVAAVVPY